MTLEKANKLALALYRVYWKRSEGGGSSLASVGFLADGTRWMAPTNWITIPMTKESIRKAWAAVAKVELIAKN